MTMIDWTKPVETTENPPRPVQVLAIDRPNPDRPIVIMRDDGQIFTVGTDGVGNPHGYANGNYGRVTLRNVAPPKPEPMLREAWVNLYAGGETGAPCSSREEVEAMANPGRAECRRITWMSDGSPVPGEASVCQYKDHAHLEAERDKWKDHANDALDELKAANDRQEQMAPVVEAAVVWERHFSAQAGERLVGAVRAYLRDVSYPRKTAERAEKEKTND